MTDDELTDVNLNLLNDSYVEFVNSLESSSSRQLTLCLGRVLLNDVICINPGQLPIRFHMSVSLYLHALYPAK